jgi:hypothetical protein
MLRNAVVSKDNSSVADTNGTRSLPLTLVLAVTAVVLVLVMCVLTSFEVVRTYLA